MKNQPAHSATLLQSLHDWLLSLGLSDSMASIVTGGVAVSVMILLAVVANYAAKRWIVSGFIRFSEKTENTWDDKFLRHKVVHRLSHLAPALVIQSTIEIALIDFSPVLTDFLKKLTNVYIVGTMMGVIDATLSALHDIYLELPVARARPIKGYLQLVKIIIFILGAILIVSILLNKDPVSLLVGMGASAAILMLVFRDSILGLVASVQVAANNMVKPGDWISMPSRGADGPVLEITLNTVKVQNWDRTISTIPTYALVSETFTNWKGMEESDGRRIKRSINIDINSVKFCSPALIKKLKKVYLLRDYIEERENEIREHNKKFQYDSSIKINGRQMTNIGMLRHYIQAYLQNHAQINSEMTFMVRQLQPTQYGIPLEIYGFSKQKKWVLYEAVQADIFDHIFAIVPEFELKLFQVPSGLDLSSIQLPSKSLRNKES